MATLTLANRLNPHQLSARQHREFRVFPTGETEYQWRIVALRANTTISRHRSLSFALRKCTRLNKQRSRGVSHAIN